MPVVMMISPEPVAFFILNSNTRYGQSTHTNIRTTHKHICTEHSRTPYTQTFLYVHMLLHSFDRSCWLARLLARSLTHTCTWENLSAKCRQTSTHQYCEFSCTSIAIGNIYRRRSRRLSIVFFIPFFTSHFHTQEHILLWQWKISNRSLSFAFDLDYLIVNAYSSSTRMYVALSPSSVLFWSGVCESVSVSHHKRKTIVFARGTQTNEWWLYF